MLANKNKIGVISDGTVAGTRVLQSDGTVMPGVVGITVRVLSGEPRVHVTLELLDVEVRMTGMEPLDHDDVSPPVESGAATGAAEPPTITPVDR